MSEFTSENTPGWEGLRPEYCAAIAVDCLFTFMKAEGKLSIAKYQQQAHNKDLQEVQRELDQVAQRMGTLRRALFEVGIPQIQFQDAHVIESIHGKRFHSMEITRTGEEPDWRRTFPPHALLDRNRRYGTDDQQAISEIKLPQSKEVLIRWFDSSYPTEAVLQPDTELIFMKDDFCMSPGTPYVDRLFWELRRQKRFHLIVFGVCDEICNLRNVLLLLASVFHVVYVRDCTFPLDPNQREPAIQYMEQFNRLGQGLTGHFSVATSEPLISSFYRVSS